MVMQLGERHNASAKVEAIGREKAVEETFKSKLLMDLRYRPAG